MLKHIGECCAGGGEKPPKSGGGGSEPCERGKGANARERRKGGKVRERGWWEGTSESEGGGSERQRAGLSSSWEEFAQTLYKFMRQWSHLKNFISCHLCHTIVVGLDTQLYHSCIESAILLVKLPSKNKVLA